MRAHGDEDLVGVLAAVGVDRGRSGRPVSSAHSSNASSSAPGRRVVVRALADPALHVAVLVLDDAGHQRLGRVEQVADPLARVADELAQQLVLGQPHVLERVGRQEAVLDDEERRLGRLGDAAGDGGQVGGLLGVAGEQDAPAGVGDAP